MGAECDQLVRRTGTALLPHDYTSTPQYICKRHATLLYTVSTMSGKTFCQFCTVALLAHNVLDYKMWCFCVSNYIKGEIGDTVLCTNTFKIFAKRILNVLPLKTLFMFSETLWILLQSRDIAMYCNFQLVFLQSMIPLCDSFISVLAASAGGIFIPLHPLPFTG